MNSTADIILGALRLGSDVLSAAVAIAAFSMLLFTLTHFRRNRLGAIFSVFMLVLAAIFSSDALTITTKSLQTLNFLQKVLWTGFILLPAVVCQFSEILNQMTGNAANFSRRLFIAAAYLGSAVFSLLLWANRLFSGIRVIEDIGFVMVPASATGAFWIWFGGLIGLAMLNFYHAYSRTRTPTSRRRMSYLIVGTIGILIGTFPLLVFSGGIFTNSVTWFWFLSFLINLMMLMMVFLLGYSVTSLCVSWSSRVIRLRLIEWMLRGPMAAILTLGALTLIRRTSGLTRIDVNAITSLVTVVSIVLMQFLVTVLMPYLERNQFAGYGLEDYQLVSGLETMMIFSKELIPYFESLISALNDQFQAKGAFIATIDPLGNLEEYTEVGEARWENLKQLANQFSADTNAEQTPILDDQGILTPVYYQDPETGQHILLAVIGLTGSVAENLDAENQSALNQTVERARVVLWQRWYLSRTYSVLRQISQIEPLDSYHRTSLLNQQGLLGSQEAPELEEVTGWVRNALTHYWGGPKLTENPLIQLDIVQQAMEADATNSTHALRSVLRQAINRIRPQGERTISGEWTLYNILNLKFIEGMRVKEVAQKLAMSEADLYRKQKVAIEEVAKTIILMEQEGTEIPAEANEKHAEKEQSSAKSEPAE